MGKLELLAGFAVVTVSSAEMVCVEDRSAGWKLVRAIAMGDSSRENQVEPSAIS